MKKIVLSLVIAASLMGCAPKRNPCLACVEASDRAAASASRAESAAVRAERSAQAAEAAAAKSLRK